MSLQTSSVQVERVGELETRDATRTRITWYTGLARLQGINAD